MLLSTYMVQAEVLTSTQPLADKQRHLLYYSHFSTSSRDTIPKKNAGVFTDSSKFIESQDANISQTQTGIDSISKLPLSTKNVLAKNVGIELTDTITRNNIKKTLLKIRNILDSQKKQSEPDHPW